MSRRRKKRQYRQVVYIIVNNVHNHGEVQKDFGPKETYDAELAYDLSQFEVKNFGDFYDFGDMLTGLFLYDFKNEGDDFIRHTLSEILKENPLIESEMIEWFENNYDRSKSPLIYETIEDIIHFVGIEPFKNQQLLLSYLSTDIS